MKHSEFLWTIFAFGHLANNVWIRCSNFSKLRVYAVYLNQHSPSLFGEHCEILRWRILRKTLKRWWGRLEKRRMATESSGDETGDETGGPGNETGDKTAATNETAATAGVAINGWPANQRPVERRPLSPAATGGEYRTLKFCEILNVHQPVLPLKVRWRWQRSSGTFTCYREHLHVASGLGGRS